MLESGYIFWKKYLIEVYNFQTDKILCQCYNSYCSLFVFSLLIRVIIVMFSLLEQFTNRFLYLLCSYLTRLLLCL
jgi:hypothetical protein